eukprot:symbB.v1.2.004017.t1/scaffold227.1/size261201/3
MQIEHCIGTAFALDVQYTARSRDDFWPIAAATRTGCGCPSGTKRSIQVAKTSSVFDGLIHCQNAADRSLMHFVLLDSYAAPGSMGVYDDTAIEGICSRLRVLVQDSFQKHLYVSAIFFADQLVTLKGPEPDEIYTLAECYFKNREYRRVLHLLKKHSEATERNDRLKLLVAQSLMECRDWEEALRYLECNWPEDQGASDPKTAACFALLRGKVYEAMENLENALMWYEQAAHLDAYCHEALERLVRVPWVKRQRNWEI